VTVKVVSFNMHDFNQGHSVVQDLISSENPDLFLLQEHWLTPNYLCSFDSHFSDYFSFGCSAMSKCLELGMLRGRPYGGVIKLIKKNLCSQSVAIHCDERFVVVKVFDYLFINLYLPCSGTKDRLAICTDLFADILSWIGRYSNCKCFIGGDFNVNLDNSDPVALLANRVMNDCSLFRCDNVFPSLKSDTYVNLSLNRYSCIDYMLATSVSDILSYVVCDPDVNFSDHLPLLASVYCSSNHNTNKQRPGSSNNKTLPQLRWDKADKGSYYYYTGRHLQPLLNSVNGTLDAYLNGGISAESVHESVESVYCSVVSVLSSGANMYVPKHRKGFFKFCWDEELSLLKEESVESNKIWKAAGKPRNGPIFQKRQSCQYVCYLLFPINNNNNNNNNNVG